MTPKKRFRFNRKSYPDVQRIQPDIHKGLTRKQVAKRIAQGKINVNINPKTKSVGAILRDNIFTLFNFLNLVLVSALIYVGSEIKNMLFMGIVLSNIAIAVVQEIRAKIATDKLSLLTAATVTVMRDGKLRNIRSEEVVLDDIIYYKPGNQVVTDCIIVDGGCEVNEAFLTGESEPVYKEKGDMIYSGSFIASGSCVAQADAVGADNAAYEITVGAKKVKSRDSEIVKSLKEIIRIVSVAILPIGIAVFFRQYHKIQDIVAATENTVAALIGMIPEGLILLTSTVLAVIVVKLAMRKVLVNELYSVEMLARTDVVCLDKTGTLTEGSMKVEDIFYVDPNQRDKIGFALASIAKSLDHNETLAAIGRHVNQHDGNTADIMVPFSSKKKWCGVYFQEKGAYILGAPEIVLTESETEILKKAESLSQDYRVLCLSESPTLTDDGSLPAQRSALCLILLSDVIRKSAPDTIAYFKKQGVQVKIISGDNPITVSNIAKKVGVDGWDKYIDMTDVEDDKIEAVAEEFVIFGRTTPIQKQLLVKALHKAGHTVAMTGDGVNDVLAMKESDCSIAVAQGTEAARAVADIVLLDSSFESVPKIVDEGRMAINNLQRSASLFLVKTIYSMLITLITLATRIPYPFIPVQLTLISALTIGIPSFFLAFQRNKDIVQGNFIKNVLMKAAPTGITIVLGVLAVNIVSSILQLPKPEVTTVSLVLTGSLALLGVLFISMPLDTLRLILVSSLSGMFVIALLFFKDMFEVCRLSLTAYITLLSVALICGLVFWVLKILFSQWLDRSKKENAHAEKTV